MLPTPAACKSGNHCNSSGGLTSALQNLLQYRDAPAGESHSQRTIMDAKLQKLERQNNALAVQNTKLAEENRSHILNLEAMDDQLERTDAEINSLMATLNSTRRQNEKLTLRLESTVRVEEQLAALELDFAELQNELGTKNNKDELANQRVQELTDKNMKLEQQNENHLLNIAAMEAQISRTDEQVKVLAETVASARRYTERIELRLEKATGAEAELQKLEAQYHNIMEELEATRNERQATFGKLERAESSLHNADEQLRKMESAVRKSMSRSSRRPPILEPKSQFTRIQQKQGLAGISGSSEQGIVGKPVFIVNSNSPQNDRTVSASMLLSDLAHNTGGGGSIGSQTTKRHTTSPASALASPHLKKSQAEKSFRHFLHRPSPGSLSLRTEKASRCASSGGLITTATITPAATPTSTPTSAPTATEATNVTNELPPSPPQTVSPCSPSPSYLPTPSTSQTIRKAGVNQIGPIFGRETPAEPPSPSPSPSQTVLAQVRDAHREDDKENYVLESNNDGSSRDRGQDVTKDETADDEERKAQDVHVNMLDLHLLQESLAA